LVGALLLYFRKLRAKEAHYLRIYCVACYFIHSKLLVARVVFTHNYCMPAIAKVFIIGNNQAIRLPIAYRVETREMWISKNAAIGEITLRPKPEPDALQALMVQLQQLPKTTEFIRSHDNATAAL
jgi:virulence-associated protein VagC